MDTRPILFVHLGSPKTPSVSDVKKYLSAFFKGPCMGEGCPSWLWQFVLHGFILPFRPGKLSLRYEKIWDGRQFLSEKIFENFLKIFSQDFISGADLLHNDDIRHALTKLSSFGKEIIVVPCFPQFSDAINGWILSEVKKAADDLGLSFSLLKSFHLFDSFLCHTAKICEHVKADHLVLSFHSYPCLRSAKGDPYEHHCHETFEALRSRITVLSKERIHLAFHSKFMFGDWLGPDIDEVLKRLAVGGAKNIALHSPSFIFDNLETTGELGGNLVENYRDKGVNIHFIPCLNADQRWAHDFLVEIKSKAHSD